MVLRVLAIIEDAGESDHDILFRRTEDFLRKAPRDPMTNQIPPVFEYEIRREYLGFRNRRLWECSPRERILKEMKRGNSCILPHIIGLVNLKKKCPPHFNSGTESVGFK